MAIRQLKDVPRTELAGKFICTPPRQRDLPYGWPARIESITPAKIAFRRLPRGVWDPEAVEWRVQAAFPQEQCGQRSGANDGLEETRYEDGIEQALMTSIRFVCDTAEEAIALYVQACATERAIERHRRVTLGELDATALAGQLPVPPYLTREAS